MIFIYLISDLLFGLNGSQCKYLLGRCAADGEGYPSWEWAMVDSEQDLVFSNGTIPRCGKYVVVNVIRCHLGNKVPVICSILTFFYILKTTLIYFFRPPPTLYFRALSDLRISGRVK